MKTFIVNKREIWTQMVEVQAENKEQAIERVRQGEGRDVENGLEYQDTLDYGTWTVDEA